MIVAMTAFKPRRRKLAAYEEHMRQRIEQLWSIRRITDELNARFGVEILYDSVREYLARRGIFSKAPRGREPVLNRERRAKVLALQEAGWSHDELAAEFELHWTTIAKNLRKARQERTAKPASPEKPRPAAAMAETTRIDGITHCPPAYCAPVQGAEPMPHSFGPTLEQRQADALSEEARRRHRDRRREAGMWR